MASFRQDMEEWQLEQMACFAERGVTVTPAASGGVHLPIVNLIADPPGTQDLIDEAMWDCSELVGRFDWWQVPLDEDVYQRILESRECVIAHGYEVPEAPSLEVWQQQGGMWFPHQFAFDVRRAEGFRWTYSVWAELNRVCPQPGPGIFCPGNLPDANEHGDRSAPSVGADSSTVGEVNNLDYWDRFLGKGDYPAMNNPLHTYWSYPDAWEWDPCEEDDFRRLLTDSPMFVADPWVRGTRTGTRINPADLDWWLAEFLPAERPEVLDLVEVVRAESISHDHSRGFTSNLAQGFEVHVRRVGTCEPALDIITQLRWRGGVPVPADAHLGFGPPDLHFADNELGRSLRSALNLDDDL